MHLRTIRNIPADPRNFSRIASTRVWCWGLASCCEKRGRIRADKNNKKKDRERQRKRGDKNERTLS